MPVSIDRRTVSTLCAPLGGLRPGATKLASLLRRLRAPGLGVQACGPAPLTARAPKCLAAPGAYPGPQGPKHKGRRRPGAVDGTGATASQGRRKERDAPQLSGGCIGGSPPMRTLWVLSLAQEKVPRLPGRDPAIQRICRNPPAKRKHPRRRERGNRLRKQVVFMGNCIHFVTTPPSNYDIIYL